MSEGTSGTPILLCIHVSIAPFYIGWNTLMSMLPIVPVEHTSLILRLKRVCRLVAIFCVVQFLCEGTQDLLSLTAFRERSLHKRLQRQPPRLLPL